jgi:hypothetical protein
MLIIRHQLKFQPPYNYHLQHDNRPHTHTYTHTHTHAHCMQMRARACLAFFVCHHPCNALFPLSRHVCRQHIKGSSICRPGPICPVMVCGNGFLRLLFEICFFVWCDWVKVSRCLSNCSQFNAFLVSKNKQVSLSSTTLNPVTCMRIVAKIRQLDR